MEKFLKKRCREQVFSVGVLTPWLINGFAGSNNSIYIYIFFFVFFCVDNISLKLLVGKV